MLGGEDSMTTDKPPDPDAGLEISEAVLKRLRKSLETPQEALLSPAQMRRRLKRKAAGGG